jgi:hypothetical protein
MNPEALKTQAMSYFSIVAARFAKTKTSMLYEVRILCYYRENAKQNQQFCTILSTEGYRVAKS